MTKLLDVFDYLPGKGNSLETRVSGVLLRNGIDTIEKLSEKSDAELLRLKGLGERGVRFIHEKLDGRDAV